MADRDFTNVKNMLQQLSVAIEQHHQTYLGQQPLVLVSQDDFDTLVDFHNTQVAPDEHKFGIDNPPYVFGAKLEPTANTVNGRFLIAKVVYYV